MKGFGAIVMAMILALASSEIFDDRYIYGSSTPINWNAPSYEYPGDDDYGYGGHYYPPPPPARARPVAVTPQLPGIPLIGHYHAVNVGPLRFGIGAGLELGGNTIPGAYAANARTFRGY